MSEGRTPHTMTEAAKDYEVEYPETHRTRRATDIGTKPCTWAEDDRRMARIVAGIIIAAICLILYTVAVTV